MGDSDNSKANRLAQMLGKPAEEPAGAEWPDKPVDLSGETFDSTLSNYPVVVVDFWANRCQPCRVMEPVMAALAKDNAGKVFFGKINTDENIELAGKYGIRSLPTFLILKNTELVDKAEGIITKDKFQSMLTEHL